MGTKDVLAAATIDQGIAAELAKRLADLYQRFGRFQGRLEINDDEVTVIMDELIELQWLADYAAGDCTLEKLRAHQAEAKSQ